MKKPGIPNPSVDPTGLFKALKQNVEIITGRRGGRIAEIDTTNITGNDLLLAQKINEILARLQD